MEAARPPRRGPRGRLRPPERDGGRVPRIAPHPAVRRSGRRGRRDARATRRAARSTPWCPSTMSPPSRARPSRARSGCAPIPWPRSPRRATSSAMRAARWPRRGCPRRPSPRSAPTTTRARRRGACAIPCVLKPLVLSASRGVIRADDEAGLRRRVPAHRAPSWPRRTSAELGEGAGHILVEDFVPGDRGRAGGPARGRGARDAGALRQARSARRAVLRGDDLRDAVAPARGDPGRVVRR